jgi:hypothetical protein
MTIIEQWFHISPDGGTGTLETIYAVIALMAASMLIFRARLLASHRRQRNDTQPM